MFSKRPTLRIGLTVGSIAYAAVAALYCVLDVLAARGGLFTLDVLGKAAFRGLRDPAALMFPHELDATAMLGYSAVHLGIACGLGVLATALVARARQYPTQALPIITAVVAGGILLVAIATGSAAPVQPVLPWWSIVVSNVSAATFAGIYLLRLGPSPAKAPLPGRLE